MRLMSFSSLALNRAPVGLLGLQMAMSFVFGVTSDSSCGMSGRHRLPASPPASVHGRTIAPSPLAMPRICM
jgi:hypothetical protein